MTWQNTPQKEIIYTRETEKLNNYAKQTGHMLKFQQPTCITITSEPVEYIEDFTYMHTLSVENQYLLQLASWLEIPKDLRIRIVVLLEEDVRYFT